MSINTVEYANQLLAENAELKELYRQSVKELDDTCFEIGMMRGEKLMEYPAPETPATDAILNEVRAQGVDMYAEHLTRKAIESGENKNHAYAYLAANFAARIRAGEVQP